MSLTSLSCITQKSQINIKAEKPQSVGAAVFPCNYIYLKEESAEAVQVVFQFVKEEEAPFTWRYPAFRGLLQA